MDALLGQIIRLTKSILLKPDEAERRPSSQFIAGRRNPLAPFSGIGLSWWYSQDTFPALDSISSMIVRDLSEFRDCDLETIRRVITGTLQEVCVDSTIFNGDDLFFRKQTLFECASVPTPMLAKGILDSIVRNLAASMARRCAVYAVPRLLASTFSITGQNISVISYNDDAAWETLEEKGFLLGGWRPYAPYFQGRKDGMFAPPVNIGCLVVAEETGTEAGARFAAILKFRMLLAVLFAAAASKKGRAFLKAAASPFKFFIQFSHESDADPKWTRNDCEPLIPFYISDIAFDAAAAQAVCDWYATTAKCGKASQERIEKGAHFLNLAMNASGLEEFVNYFIVLDAIFGRRGAVETSIREGVAALGDQSRFSEKVGWLFELRNDLVHGGARYIEEWPKYGRYKRYFQSNPLDDVKMLAEIAVLKAPSLLGRG